MSSPDSRHLDLGCGERPRNPYGRQALDGLDVMVPREPLAGVAFHAADLSWQPIPFEAGAFDSVSAYDFVEHVPRHALVTRDGRTQSISPFVELMNEVWRVLKPGGLFLAVTPCFPAPDVFTDPTHVNVITKSTHKYFCGENCLGRAYGFRGNFEAVTARFGEPADWRAAPFHPGASDAFRQFVHKFIRPRYSHFVWELRAVKQGGSGP